MVVSTDIQHNGNDTVRMNACAQCVDDELRHADQDSAHALIANPQNLLAVAARDDVDIFRRTPEVKDLLDVVRFLDVEEAAFWSPKQAAVVCDCVAFLRAGVDTIS